ncbi:MAG: NUDIX hydrolase [Nanoarchaeota archaeon]|nr:NUDIX hydrolase [Nanoarchaeota archaeon]
MVYELNPLDFNPVLEVTGCIIESKGKIILVKRKDSKVGGGKWGIPSGKVEKKENLLDSIQREIKEETGIEVNKKEINFIHTYKVRRNGEYDFIYHLFYTKMANMKKILLNKEEHLKAIWISPAKALKLPLVEGTDKFLKNIYG